MFIAADGLNYEDANSYVSTEYADAYFSLRGNEIWAAATTNQKEVALVKATDYIDQTYGQRWIGSKYRMTGLEWPRYCTVYDADTIPENLKKATCELALEALTTPLNQAITRERAVKREKVDIIEVEYSDTGTMPTIYPAVTGYLSSLLSGSTFNRKVVRV